MKTNDLKDKHICVHISLYTLLVIIDALEHCIPPDDLSAVIFQPGHSDEKTIGLGVDIETRKYDWVSLLNRFLTMANKCITKLKNAKEV